jgi:spermidine synthase
MSALFLLTGFSYTVLQILAIRELLVSFSGNELSVGLVLGAWLLVQAAGSGLAGRLVRVLPARPRWYALVPAALALLLLPTMVLIIRMHALLGVVPGAAVGFLATFGAAFLVLAPVGLVGGGAFVVACRVLSNPAAAGRVYFLEAAGSILGGIAFTYLLLPLLTSTQIVLLLIAVNALAAAAWWLAQSWMLPGVPIGRKRARSSGGSASDANRSWGLPRPYGASLAFLLLGLAGVVALVIIMLPLGPALHRSLVAGRWAPYTLAYEGNSPYGNVAVLASEGQVAVFANGTLVLTAPDPDAAAVEQLVHLPALFLDDPPQRVLVIGGGPGGVLHEVERYALVQLDYTEPDPWLIGAVEAVPTALTSAELADPRLRLAAEDGRRFVQHATGPYDLVLLNLPPPTTLVLNRLYTREFMVQVGDCLAPRGVLAITAPPARTYLAPAAAGLLASTQRTLAAALDHVRLVPADEQTLWLASSENPLELDVDTLVGRWEKRGLEGRVLREDYLRYLLDPAVVRELDDRLAATPAKVNRDVAPAGLRHALAYESARLSPQLEPFFQLLGQLRWWHAAAGVVLLAGVGLWLGRKRQLVAIVAVGTTGLAGMTANVLILLTFQVLYGSLYQQVGLLTTAFMAGLTVGAFGMTVWAGRLRRPWRGLFLLEGANALAAAGLAGWIVLLLRYADPAVGLAHALLLVANAAVGLLVGMEFSLANHILTAETGRPSHAAASLYTADLVGAMVGAVAVAAVLLPALGLVGTALLVALVKGASLALVFARSG